jgi:hypothetical protein
MPEQPLSRANLPFTPAVEQQTRAIYERVRDVIPRWNGPCTPR